MSVILSCAMPLTAILFISISFQTRDEIATQINLILGTLIFLVSFLFGPLLIKLVMVLVFLIFWRYLGARLSI